MRAVFREATGLYSLSNDARNTRRQIDESLRCHRVLKVRESCEIGYRRFVRLNCNALRFSEVSSNCEGYAKPSLCYSAFPICRDPASILKLKNSKSLFHLLNNNQGVLSKDTGDGDEDDISRSHGIPRKRSPTLGAGSEFNPYKDGKPSSKKMIGMSYGDAQSTSRNEINRKLRRICRQECELLENELCRKEYAIAKRHPLIGHQVPLINCSDLPMEDTPEARDCLSLGLSTENNVQESK